VWRIRGAYNALAVEFADHVVLFEPGPQNEDRAKAIIAETRRVIPGKPIRYGVISHHHFDHTSGLPAVVAEGITIVTPKVNERFLERRWRPAHARARRDRGERQAAATSKASRATSACSRTPRAGSRST
jgi:glyoxylase-like metal-dependent hydrolase (beta-lactamase superfamily II)